MESLIATGHPITLVSLGSPYLIRSFPRVSAYLTTYTPVATAEVAAVKALFGEIDINGHLPVTIRELPISGSEYPCRAARSNSLVYRRPIGHQGLNPLGPIHARSSTLRTPFPDTSSALRCDPDKHTRPAP